MFFEKVIEKTLELLYTSVVAEGGDGDAYWLTKHNPLPELMNVIEKFNINHNTGWSVSLKGDYIEWGSNQEWVMITDKETFWNDKPDWIILKLDF